MCQPPSKRRRNRRTDERTDRRRESNLVHFSLKMWHLVAMIFNEFPDNQLTKFRVFIGWSRVVISLSLKFLWSIAVRSPIGWTPPRNTTERDKRTSERTDGRTDRDAYLCSTVGSSLRWSNFDTDCFFCGCATAGCRYRSSTADRHVVAFSSRRLHAAVLGRSFRCPRHEKIRRPARHPVHLRPRGSYRRQVRALFILAPLDPRKML